MSMHRRLPGLPFSLLALMLLAPAIASAQRTLELVSARDQIEGSFLADKAVFADRSRIYLTSFQGELFVLARDRAADFPVLQVIQVSPSPLTAVRGDNKHLYVTSADGNLRVYRKTEPLTLVATVNLSTFGLGAVAVQGKNVYVARGTRAFNVDGKYVYLAQLNEGDVGIEVSKDRLQPGMTFGEVFEINTTVIFSRRTGDRVFAIPNPRDLFGTPQLPNLYVDGKILARTVPGCCGLSIEIFDADTFSFMQRIARSGANTVVRDGRWLIVGTESGEVDLIDLRQNPSPTVSSVNLRLLTGHTGVEDIEIRALWMDHHDDLIFAASSWGNDASRGPELPSFFVLERSKR